MSRYLVLIKISMKKSDLPVCCYTNIKGVRCTRKCMKFTDINTARCSEHKFNKQNVPCQFPGCPNFHHTVGLICSGHGSKTRLEYMKSAPGVIINKIELVEGEIFEPEPEEFTREF